MKSENLNCFTFQLRLLRITNRRYPIFASHISNLMNSWRRLPPPKRFCFSSVCYCVAYPVGVQSVAISVYVCLSADLINHTHVQISRQFEYMLPVTVALFFSLQRRCNKLFNSSFVDDVMFSHNGASGPESVNVMFHRILQATSPGVKSNIYDCLVWVLICPSAVLPKLWTNFNVIAGNVA